MKNITIPVEDEIYEAAVAEAARQQKSVETLLRQLVEGLGDPRTTAPEGTALGKLDFAKLWAWVDSRPSMPGSAGPLNREELHQRGVSRY